MEANVRPLDVEKDFPRVAELMTRVETKPVTVEILQDREKKWSEQDLRHRLVATDADGNIIAYAQAHHRDYEKPGYFRLWVIVEPLHSRQGLGSRLTAELEAFANQHEATRLSVTLRDNDRAAQGFAERRGFRTERHIFESALELTAFDPAPFAGIREEVEASGLHFFSFADTDGSEAAQRKLYDLNTITGYDQPGGEDEPARPFEQFAKDVFGGYWFRPDGQIFAAEGEHWVGMAAVGEIAPGVMYNMHTGVLREYRGRKIAQALKLLALDFCRKHQASSIRTNNDSRNAPMLAINHKLGYRPEPGWHILLKDISK
jgi:GNAT superfamily N-acetyltransferase